MANDRSLVLFDDDEDEDDDGGLTNIRKKLLPELNSGTGSVIAEQEHVKVFLLIRPFTSEEIEKHENQV
jgi:hypothetical protein